MKEQPVDPRISILKDISPLLTSVLDTESVLEMIIESVTRLMEAKASSLLLVDKNTNKLYFHVATGAVKEEVKTFEIKMGQGIAGHVALTGKPLLISDVSKDERWDKTISEATGFETRSIACVPIKSGDEVIGVIEIIDREDGQAIRESDMEILSHFSQLASVAIERAKDYRDIVNENISLKKELESRYEIIGTSKAMEKVIADAVKVANSKTTTLITGESGTGKELVARLIHKIGPRRKKRLMMVNCAAFTETLLESELFGHEKGAFTGAIARKTGVLDVADGGTLFLDEVAEMSPSMQVKLLRVIQEGTFSRVGSPTPRKVDIRVIAATNKDLFEQVQKGKFREDLYYRLNVVHIHIPPLRERREDILVLAQYFLDRYKPIRGTANLKFASETMQVLENYHWPGNVRELQNAIERAVVMGNNEEIQPEDLPFSVVPAAETSESLLGLSLKEALDSWKRDFLQKNLDMHGGSVKATAKTLDIQRTYLSRLISKYELATKRRH
ncbi:MAG: sigma 54-interacting transcriptional regulator [Deltaproteobacteria bacterium]|nr:sigma 54-interacting transcriptional regulator [Deltaproteobacteria bacterium]MBW2070020.1 sigma 54-interacting transcriptional regulator [Deltaproteobacteria bacterium]